MTWRNVTIKQYMDIKAIPAELPSWEREDRIMAIVFGWPLEKVEALSFKKRKKYQALIRFVNDPTPAKFKKVIWINGTRYKARTKVDRYSPEIGLSLIAHRNAGINKTMNKCLGWIYAPTFTKHDPEKAAEDMLKAKVSDVLGCFFLFSVKAKLSNLAISAYKQEQMEILQEHLEAVTNHFQGTGAGITPSAV